MCHFRSRAMPYDFPRSTVAVAGHPSTPYWFLTCFVRTFVTGFLQGDVAYGRPVAPAVDKRGGLLIADDAGNAAWRVTSR